MNDVLRHVLQIGIGIWLQSAWLLLIGLAFGRLVRSRGALAASAAYRGTLVSVCVSCVLGICLAGHIRPLLTINLPSKPALASTMSTSAASTFTAPAARPLSVSQPHYWGGSPSDQGRQQLHAAPVRRLPVYGIVLGTWAAIAVVQILWLLVGLLWLWRLGRRASTVTEGRAVDILSHLAGSLGIRRPRLVTSTLVRSPFVSGIFRPTIYLPTGFADDLDTVELRAILAHELAHVRQGDCRWNMAFHLIRALLWTQPLVWILRKRWQETSEQVCDQWVLSFDCPPNVYADCLLRLAKGLPAGIVALRPENVAGVGVFSFKSILGRRIQAILTRTQFRLLNLSRRDRAAVALTTAVAAVTTVFLISTPARSMVRKQMHRLAAIAVVAEKHSDRLRPVTRRSNAHMKAPHVNKLLPALLALASGAVQVNLPASDAPATKPAPKPTISTPATPAPKVTDSADIAVTPPDNSRGFPVAPSTSPSADTVHVDTAGGFPNCTLDFQNVPVKRALKELFDACHVSYSIEDNIDGNVNISLTNVGLLPALKSLCKASVPALTFDVTDGVYRVHYHPVDQVAEAQSSAAPDIRFYKLPLDHETPDTMIKRLDDNGYLAGDNGAKISVTSDKNENAMVLHCTPEQFAKLREAVKIFDTAPRMISFEAKVVTATSADIAKLGLDPSTMAGNLSVDNTEKLKAALASGKLHVDMSPVITATSGMPASISMKSNGPTPSGMSLSVTPTVYANDSIATAIHIEATGANSGTQTQTFDVNPVFLPGETGLVAAVNDGSGNVRLDFATAHIRPDVDQREAAMSAAGQIAQ